MILSKRTEVSNQMPEREYRNLRDRLSYSNLKTYATNRTKFVKECILGQISDKESTVSTIVGDICHVLLAEQEGEFDNKFHIASAIEPTGQVGELVEALYRRALKSLDENGVQRDQFEVLFTDAVNTVKYDYDMKEVKFVGKNLEKILALFTEPDKKGAVGELYYKEKMACTGKQVVSVSHIQSAEKLAEQLRTHEYTKDIVNLKTGGDIEVFNELVILYEIDGVLYRSMIDKLVVDHGKKLITPYDYKCTWSNEDGFQYNYIKNMYWLQIGLYDMAIWHWKREHGLEYKVEGMRYIACDTTGNNAPVIYRLNAQDIEMAKHGFTLRGKRYPGVIELQKAIQWHVNTGNWTTTEEIDRNKGIMELGIAYDK